MSTAKYVAVEDIWNVTGEYCLQNYRRHSFRTGHCVCIHGRHDELNDIIKRASTAADIHSKLELV